MAKSIYRVYPVSDYIPNGINITETSPGKHLFTFDEYQQDVDAIVNVQLVRVRFFQHMAKYDTIPHVNKLSLVKGWKRICNNNPSNFIVKIIKIIDIDGGLYYFIHAGKVEAGSYQRTYLLHEDSGFIDTIREIIPKENVIYTTVELGKDADDVDCESPLPKVYGEFNDFIGTADDEIPKGLFVDVKQTPMSEESRTCMQEALANQQPTPAPLESDNLERQERLNSDENNILLVDKEWFDSVSQMPISDEGRKALQDAKAKYIEITSDPEKLAGLTATLKAQTQEPSHTPVQTAAAIIEKTIRRLADVLNETADEIRNKFKL